MAFVLCSLNLNFDTLSHCYLKIILGTYILDSCITEKL